MKKLIFTLMILTAALFLSAGTCERKETKNGPPPGFGIRPGATYPVEYDYSGPSTEFPGDDLEKPGPVLVWDRDDDDFFDYGDRPVFHLNRQPLPVLPQPPIGPDNQVKMCEPPALIEATEDTAVPACQPFPAAAVARSCEAMLKLAAMGCKQLCDFTEDCPLAFPMVPPHAQAWQCRQVDGRSMVQCKGLVECKCGPEA